MATITNHVSSYGVREGMILEWQASRLRIGVVKVAFGSSENYATGGIAVESGIKSAMSVDTVLAVVPMHHDVGGWMPLYDASNGKLKFYGQEPTNSTSGVIALSEMPDGSTAINGKTVYLLVVAVD